MVSTKEVEVGRRRRRWTIVVVVAHHSSCCEKESERASLEKESESVSFVQLLHWKKGSLYSGISSSSETAPLSVCVRVWESVCDNCLAVAAIPRVWEGRGELRMRFSGKAIHPRRPHRKASCRLCNFEKRTLYLSLTHTPTLCLSLSLSLSLSHTHVDTHVHIHIWDRQKEWESWEFPSRTRRRWCLRRSRRSLRRKKEWRWWNGGSSSTPSPALSPSHYFFRCRTLKNKIEFQSIFFRTIDLVTSDLNL